MEKTRQIESKTNIKEKEEETNRGKYASGKMDKQCL